jgi:hypothetical protein
MTPTYVKADDRSPTPLVSPAPRSEPRDRAELRRLDDKMMAPMARSLPAGPIKQVVNRSQLERDWAGAILPRSDWGRPCLSGRTGTMVEASDWLHCPFDSSTLPSEKTARMRQQGKAVGCVPPTGLLF